MELPHIEELIGCIGCGWKKYIFLYFLIQIPMKHTEEQLRIFEFVKNEKSHGIIDAVAGAGKTTTIMECVKYIDDKTDALFCAFNNSIAGEISKKFHQKGFPEVTVKTMHALGRSILQENNSTGLPITLKEDKYRELMKNEDLLGAVLPYFENIARINDYDTHPFDDRQKFALNSLYNNIKNKLLDINQKYRATLTKDNIESFKEMVIHYGIFNDIDIKKKDFSKELENYYLAHQVILEEGNELSWRTMMIDFTDMLYLPYKWELEPSKKYNFLFIDECQDLSKSQLAIAMKYGKKSGRILAVGDPRQSIYGFTGADIESFNRIKDLTKATALPLTECFRCPGDVVRLAQHIRPDIKGNKPDSNKIHRIPFAEIVKLAKAGDLIISRFRDPILVLVFNFIDNNIKVHIHEDEAREIINEIKSVFKQDELNAVIAHQPRRFESISDAVYNRWKWIITKNAAAIIDSKERTIYIDEQNEILQQKLRFLNKKYELWQAECRTITDILKKIKEFISAPSDSIKLSTIHRAKGLENQRVFILGYDELPFKRVYQKDWEKIQEMNLKYVAITRSLEELYLIEDNKQQVIEDEGSLFDLLPI